MTFLKRRWREHWGSRFSDNGVIMMMKQSAKQRKWSMLVAEQIASGKNAAAWCREHHIGYSLFLYWKYKLGTAGSDSAMMVLDFGNGLRLEMSPMADEKMLRRIISVVHEACQEPADDEVARAGHGQILISEARKKRSSGQQRLNAVLEWPK
jgi:hypothetical protein